MKSGTQKKAVNREQRYSLSRLNTRALGLLDDHLVKETEYTGEVCEFYSDLIKNNSWSLMMTV